MIVAEPMEQGLTERLAGPASHGLRIYWLGQAGFVVEIGGVRLVIDPYLSDSLAHKYRDGPFSYNRMMPAPIAPDRFGSIDAVLVTHGHTDHLDPDTLGPMFLKHRETRLICPRAIADQAAERSGCGRDRLVPVDAGETVRVGTVAVTATRAAHETLETDANGDHRFLGYAIAHEGLCVWHSGDCVPFPGLIEEVRRFSPLIGLLPVNGRRAELTSAGIAGNFTLDEAVETAIAAGSRTMIAHHHSLFAFNTCPVSAIDEAASRESRIHIERARLGICYTVDGGVEGHGTEQ